MKKQKSSLGSNSLNFARREKSSSTNNTCQEKNLRKEIFFREGGRGEPPYPPYHKNLGCQGEIAKPGCQGKSFDANFLEKDLANLGSSAYAIRMKIELVSKSQIGRCYSQYLYRVTSKEFISDQEIYDKVAEGQEFFFTRSIKDGLQIVNATSRVDSSD